MSSKNQQEIIVNNVPITWNDLGKGFNFFGIDSILFWTNPSLVSILNPLRNEIGDELYSLLVAYEATKGTYEDYHSMVNSLGQNFEEGFLNWGKAVSTAGWGSFSINSINYEQKEAIIQIDEPWELKIFKANHPQDSIPFLKGKISGIFSHAFQTNCRGEILQVTFDPNKVILKIAPSNETLEMALSAVQERKKLSETAQLKMINSALRTHQQRLQDVLTTIGERIWELDDRMIFRHLSDKTSTRLNLDPKLTVGQSIIDWIHPEDLPSFLDACEKLKAGKIALADIRTRIKTNTPDYFWAQFKFKILNDLTGNPNGFLGSTRDINDEVLLEKQIIEQRERSMNSSKMASLGEMASGIAHEINNPLTEIIANAWMIKSAIRSNEMSQEQIIEALDTIEKTGKRMASIIKGMRAFSRDAGVDPFTPYSVEAIVEDTLVFCRSRFANNGVALKTIVSNPHLRFDCRPTQISQVILNLLNNSFDAVQSLKEKWIEVKIENCTELVRVSITDSGKGLDSAIISRIMQPFFTTKGPGKGTGLGLSISRGIIEAHDGRFFYDEKSENTRFVFEIPIHMKR